MMKIHVVYNVLSLNSLLFTLALEKLGIPRWCSGKKKKKKKIHLGIPNFSRASVKRREFRESTLYTTCIFIINVCFDQRSYP